MEWDEGVPEDLPPAAPPRNMCCCHSLLKCMFCIREFLVILFSTVYGLIFLFTSLMSIFFLLPLNLYFTHGVAKGGFLGSHSTDLAVNLLLFMQAITNFLFALHALTLTVK